MSQLSYWKVLTRKKTLTHDHETETNLNRVLGTYDLTALGVGATLGVGVYVLAGHVAKDQAGPSVIISFLIAALASLLAGLCYAEFGARVPKAGSAYIYSYVCIGEFAAFIIGWNLILEYVIGSASVCRGISLYLDTLLNNTLKVTFSEVTPIDWGFLGAYFDFFAFALAIIFGVGIAFGIQASAVLNNFCTLINIGVVVFVIVAGSIKADIKNWQIDPSEINNSTLDEGTKLGSGGFFPFGFGGTLRGAATCFFGFVGFDCIATTGEEVKEPRRAIPRAILFSLLIIFLSYFGVSTVLTLMWPYYLQNIDAPLPYAFEQIGWEVAKWIVTIGGMLGLIASLLGALLPLPRIIYAMSQDGLIFKFLGIINKRFKTPVIASICAAFLTGFFAGLFDLTQLVNMLSIGTLLAYTVIAICLTILRFMDNSNEYSNIEYKRPNNNEDTILVNNNYSSSSSQTTCRHIVIQIFNLKRNRIPSSLSTTIVTVMLLIYCACAFGFSLTVMYASEEILNLAPWAITLLCLFGLINIFITFAISIQPREEENPYFKVPLVPLTPAISIFVNIYLMLQLDMYTWIRFGIWMIIGLIIYLPCICLYDRTKCDISKSSDLKYTPHYSDLKCSPTDDDIKNNHLNDEKVLQNGTAQFCIKNELDQNSNEITESNISPSPKTNIDDIILESEFSDSLKEMKHSNGDRYLVEHNNPKAINDEPDENITNEDSNDVTKSVLDILDNVLQEESENYQFGRQMSIDSEQIPSFHNVSTAVIIHRPNDCFAEEVENETVNIISSESKDSGIELDKENEIESNIIVNDTEITLTENSNDKIIQETSMATANPGLVNLNSNENLNEETESDLNIEQVLIPGSNLLINSPKIQKSNKIDSVNPNIIDDTPRPSLNSEIKNAEIIKEIQDNTVNAENLQKSIIPDSISNDLILSSDENSKNSIKEQPNPSSPKVTRTFIPLKSHNSPTLNRKSSKTSITSYEDPLHSDSFKEKLSRIMGQNVISKTKNPVIPVVKQNHKENSKENEIPSKILVKDTQNEIPDEKRLKPSKSETDVLKLLHEDIKKQRKDDNVELNPIREASKTLNENNIPKPPKFDPILYKSLGANSSRHSKERPKLEELVGKDNITHQKNQSTRLPTTLSDDTQNQKNQSKTNEIIEEKSEEIPTPEQFKKKLAAIIQRGPSYKIQRQYPPPSPKKPTSDLSKEVTLNSNDENVHKNNYSDVLKSIRNTRKSIAKPIDNISQSSNKIGLNENNQAISLENVRKNLKPINRT